MTKIKAKMIPLAGIHDPNRKTGEMIIEPLVASICLLFFLFRCRKELYHGLPSGAVS